MELLARYALAINVSFFILEIKKICRSRTKNCIAALLNGRVLVDNYVEVFLVDYCYRKIIKLNLINERRFGSAPLPDFSRQSEAFNAMVLLNKPQKLSILSYDISKPVVFYR
jgi:hypothetical protein